MPAILKGWFERVYLYGFGYGLGEYNDKRWGDRYGDGKMLGKRAFLLVMVGWWKEHLFARGIAGPIDDVLFLINYGMLYYTGFVVLPAFVVYLADWFDDEKFWSMAIDLRQKLKSLSDERPIAYRCQNGGDYELLTLVLKDGLGDSSAPGFSLHVMKEELGGLSG